MSLENLNFINNVSKVTVTKSIKRNMLECISKFIDDDIYDYEYSIQSDTRDLQDRLVNEMPITKDNIRNILWLLNRYGYHSTVSEIKAQYEKPQELDTVYEGGD